MSVSPYSPCSPEVRFPLGEQSYLEPSCPTSRPSPPPTEPIPPPFTTSPALHIRRSSLPITSFSREVPPQIKPMSTDELVDLLQREPPKATVVDIRPYCDYVQSRIHGALHFCIPSTFLKRASYSFRRTVENMVPEQRCAFDRLDKIPTLVVYDRSSEHLQTSQTNLLHTLMKFINAEEWPSGQKAYYLVGGLEAWSQNERVQKLNLLETQVYKCEGEPPEFAAIGFSRASTAPESTLPGAIPFPLVTSGLRQNPLFKSVRAAMEVHDDEYIEVQVPPSLKPNKDLPRWVNTILNDPIAASKKMAEEFRNLEQAEKNRMFGALSIKSDSENYFDRRYSISGIELGVKNRYDNIYPYEHTRVKLSSKGCDYINASHIGSSHSGRKYIATQAPLPETFADFFHMIWEEEVPVIVQLAPEFEGAMLKCHNYWGEGTYGLYSVHVFGEKTVDVDANDGIVAIIRTFQVTRNNSESRKVTQIFYEAWPDLGRPANPADLLRLMQLKDQILIDANYPIDGTKVVVHCSAGCGRTGTFCAIDILCDILGRGQYDKDKDVVAEVVAELRTQRTSMVQSLRQYVLCYDSVLAWLARNH